MKTKNNLTTGILIGISVIVLPIILMSTSATTNNEIIYGTPESHVWEFHLSNPSSGGNPASSKSGMAFAINKKTGEVRKYDSYSSNSGKKSVWSDMIICND